ncbi:TRAP transporter small permease subunit [Roseibium algae]|uniref:TRAP transporter small permease protein n=1 Tax=Roseibium algae TaxID=3123038 RepID=A0ABU8TI42_9HYPH
MHRFTIAVSWIFGLLLLGLSLFVSLETISRKLLNYSFQGADELGGYILAICGSLSFTVALIERGHVRIDFLHDRFSPRIQAMLNFASLIVLTGLGFFFVRYCYAVVRDTIDYGSTAATPWATPLIYPQSLWYCALAIFFITCVCLLVSSALALAGGEYDRVNADFGPKGAMEELNDELDDLAQR